MLKEICIDNGGTLTDVCVLEGAQIWTTKTLTTPFDLSQCLFDGLRKVSADIYGEDDVGRLLAETSTIKYSTTQGTNSLVERKGPRLGLLVSADFDISLLAPNAHHKELLAALVGERIVAVDTCRGHATSDTEIIRCTNTLAELGTSRIVVCFTGSDYADCERDFVSQYENSFLPHHLGTVPLSVAHETSGDADEVRRIWSAILNAFLHPPMENFLFNAQKRLQNYRSGSTFRIFRNDGGAARVSKTAALKTYSSGPRGGMEAVRAVAAKQGYGHVLSVDVGGTTSDLGCVENAQIQSALRGKIEGVESSFELCDIVSIGVGGGSVIRAASDGIEVGPESVGAVPGPACFGLGGTSATVTDAFLAIGYFDPESFFEGSRALDRTRAEAAIASCVAEPLGLSVIGAAHAMRATWVQSLADGIRKHTPPRSDTVLLAFGGAGPMAICEIADELDIRLVLIPQLAAMFSAVGVSFSEVTQEYEAAVTSTAPKDLADFAATILRRATRDMEAEGVCLADCTLRARVVAGGQATDVDIRTPESWPAGAESLQIRVSAHKERGYEYPASRKKAATASKNAGERTIRDPAGHTCRLPVYQLSEYAPGDEAVGPAVLEGQFFTAHLPEAWTLKVVESGDFLLERNARGPAR